MLGCVQRLLGSPTPSLLLCPVRSRTAFSGLRCRAGGVRARLWNMSGGDVYHFQVWPVRNSYTRTPFLQAAEWRGRQRFRGPDAG